MPRRYFSNIQNQGRYKSFHKEELPDVMFEYSIYKGITKIFSIPRDFARAIKNKITNHR